MSADLPDRAELAQLVRRFRIEGYELDDLVQEACLCLLDPDSDHDIVRHLRRLQRQSFKRRKHVIASVSIDGDSQELKEDNTRLRLRDDLAALVLLWAAQSECEGNDRLLLDMLSDGTSYAELCSFWHCNKTAAWKRISRFREELYPKLYPEDE